MELEVVVIEGTVNITGCWTSTWTVLPPNPAGSSSKPTSLTVAVRGRGNVTSHRRRRVAEISAVSGLTLPATTSPNVALSMSSCSNTGLVPLTTQASGLRLQPVRRQQYFKGQSCPSSIRACGVSRCSFAEELTTNEDRVNRVLQCDTGVHICKIRAIVWC